MIAIKHEVTDPAFYNPLISKQKKKARRNPGDEREWLDLGRLYEARLEMTRSFVKKHFSIRWLPCIATFLFLASLVLIYFYHHQIFLVIKPPLLSTLLFAIGLVLVFMWSARHPLSGTRYFRKAVALDPKLGEAYIYLGLIALRRYQKRKACQYLEAAVKLNAGEKNKIERNLKSIYEKEFFSFFNKKSEKDIEQQQIMDHQLDQIKTLRIRKASLEKMVAGLNDKLDQARWETGHNTKVLGREMKEHVSMIRQDHEKQMAAMKLETGAEAKEQADRKFAQLSMEIMESKASLEVQSLEAAAQTVENMVGPDIWLEFSEQTRSFLATAEQVYAVLTEQEENPDYSLVGMELCKALEVELNRKIVEPFTEYLNGNDSAFLKINKTGKNNGRRSYFTYLARVVDQKNYPEVNFLTLGQCHFALKQAIEGDYTLSAYNDFLDDMNSASGAIIGQAFLGKLKIVTQKYRNTIAHQFPMNREEYENLRALVLEGNGTLLQKLAICSRSSI